MFDAVADAEAVSFIGEIAIGSALFVRAERNRSGGRQTEALLTE